ncbi:hypothetical protein [Sansalvadorimonas verongulae]|uniref:hypothetical protein n=1 Tax=Sansalvadorimonas verongulae TaxID=2172824 RepID=UPI0012BD800D|nr:hypothetical protein [Sansalvadorimonas verongulae]MTI14735.1 hypothetical protein [Sansalvadorimonas verongulae]
MKGVFRSLVLTVSLASPMVLATDDMSADAEQNVAPPIVAAAIAYAVPATAYSHSALGKIDEGSKALARKLYIEYSQQVLNEQFEGRRPDQLLWLQYLKAVYIPLRDFMYSQIDGKTVTSSSKISDPDKVKQRISRKLQEWSVKAFYYYFNPSEQGMAAGFADKKGEVVSACKEILGSLAQNAPGSQLSDYYQSCYHPVSDLPGATLTPLIPTDDLATVLLSQARLAVNPEGVPPRLAQAVTWYATLSDQALSSFESAIADKSEFKDIMMKLFRRGYSPETLAKIFRQHFVDFDLAYRKIWYYYEKHKAKEWYRQKNVKTFDS